MLKFISRIFKASDLTLRETYKFINDMNYIFIAGKVICKLHKTFCFLNDDNPMVNNNRYHLLSVIHLPNSKHKLPLILTTLIFMGFFIFTGEDTKAKKVYRTCSVLHVGKLRN